MREEGWELGMGYELMTYVVFGTALVTMASVYIDRYPRSLAHMNVTLLMTPDGVVLVHHSYISLLPPRRISSGV